jgi:hypothetical protein
VGKRRSNGSVTGKPASVGPTGITDSAPQKQNKAPADFRKPAGPFVYYATGIVLVAVIALVALVWWNHLSQEDEAPPKSADERVCENFINKRHAVGPAVADAMLGRVPVAPAGELTEDEAERLQTDFFLHDPELEIIKLRPRDAKQKDAPLVLVTKGNVAAPRLAIRLKDGELSSQQRTMSNPDVYVEVRDGKIYGVRSTLPRD